MPAITQSRPTSRAIASRSPPPPPARRRRSPASMTSTPSATCWRANRELLDRLESETRCLLAVASVVSNELDHAQVVADVARRFAHRSAPRISARPVLAALSTGTTGAAARTRPRRGAAVRSRRRRRRCSRPSRDVDGERLAEVAPVTVDQRDREQPLLVPRSRAPSSRPLPAAARPTSPPWRQRRGRALVRPSPRARGRRARPRPRPGPRREGHDIVVAAHADVLDHLEALEPGRLATRLVAEAARPRPRL